MRHGYLKFSAVGPNASVNFRIKSNFLITNALEFRSQVCLYSHLSNVRHPRCVLYNSKGLGMLTLTVEHNYICF